MAEKHARKHKGTLFGKKPSDVIKKPGSETQRAREHGRSLHAQAEIDSHSSNKHIRGKGTFALAAQRGSLSRAKKLDHKIGKKRALARHDKKHGVKRHHGRHTSRRSAR